jgi:hypothetical protein
MNAGLNIVRKIVVLRKGGILKRLIALLACGSFVEVYLQKSSGEYVKTELKIGRVYNMIVRGDARLVDEDLGFFLGVYCLIDSGIVDKLKKK